MSDDDQNKPADTKQPASELAPAPHAVSSENLQATAEFRPRDHAQATPISSRGIEAERRKSHKKLESQLEEEGGSIQDQERGAALRKRKAHDAKRRRKYAMYGIAAVVVIFIGTYLFKPFEGTIEFGICKTFLETQVRYPDKLRLSTVENIQGAMRIWYSSLDSFGEYRLQPIECFFATNAQGQLYMRRAKISRRDLDQSKVDAFNVSIPYLIENPPDLTLPTPLPDRLSDLQINSFSRPLF